ncbi:MAG: hypothetical protein LBQ54_10560 [Planctomycetaceae bacterium]|nr:hypothetical protein [Planctomycetaceae bacterium]
MQRHVAPLALLTGIHRRKKGMQLKRLSIGSEPNAVSVSKSPVAARDRMERSDHEATARRGFPAVVQQHATRWQPARK